MWYSLKVYIKRVYGHCEVYHRSSSMYLYSSVPYSTYKSHDSHHGAPEYRRLIAIDAGKPKGGIDECLKVDPDKVRRLSLSEQQLEKISATHGKEIVRYQRIFISFFFLVV